MLFAELSDAAMSWNVVLTLSVLATLALTCVQLVRANRAQKRQVSFEFDPASKADFDKHVEHNSRIHDLLFDKIENVNGSSTEELKRVRERVAGVETEARTMNQRIAQVDAKLDRLIERKVAV
jgi:hypothetical protein